MASKREIVGIETMIGAYGCELIDTTTEFVPPKGLAIGSIIPTEETTIDFVYQLVRGGGLRTRIISFTAQADYPAVASAVAFIAADHGLLTGDKVIIDSAIAFFDYNGTYEIVVVDHDTFYIIAPHGFMGDYGADVCTAMVSHTTEELIGKNWLGASLPQGTQIFPNWNNPITNIVLDSGAVMVYFVKI